MSNHYNSKNRPNNAICLQSAGASLLRRACFVILAACLHSTLSASGQDVQRTPIRIGVTPPKVEMREGSSVANLGDTLRSLLIQDLSEGNLDIVPITAAPGSQAEAEAKQKQCDYVLDSSMTLQSKGSGMGLLRKAAPMASIVPMFGAIGEAASIAGAEGASRATKAKTEGIFQYKLNAPGNPSPILSNSVKAKADGQDVLSPLVKQAAQTILAEISKKK